MYNCSEFNSLSVLSLYEGELLGIVHKLYFDKKLKKLIEIEVLADNGLKLILPTKNIYHIGKNAITVKNNQTVHVKVESNDLVPCPTGSKVYTINGEFLGIVKDLSINEKYFTEKLSLEDAKTVEILNLASCGKNTLIFYKDNKPQIKKLAPKLSPKSFKPEQVQTATILPTEQVSQNESSIQSKKVVSANFLVGRTCTKNIFNFNNEILIKENSKITKKILKEIIKFGKIKELLIYSK